MTHGHHTASAILAQEAFAAASDSNRFSGATCFRKTVAPDPARLEHIAIFLLEPEPAVRSSRPNNPGSWRYNPLLGKAYTEIAAASLSMHKSQGVAARRGAGHARNISNYWKASP